LGSTYHQQKKYTLPEEMTSAPQQGLETRNGSQMLPSEPPAGFGMLGSPYSVSDSLLTPAQVGVHKGDDMGSVVDAVKGMAFYVDQIGFGESSNRLTQGMPLKPLGINYFMNTGQTCSNGATMYQYYEGIPQGNALGEKVKTAMKEMGLPGLRGLAPGMLEDAQGALNPGPLLDAMLGTGYPQCKQVMKMVGDAYGHVADPATGASWIESPETAFKGNDNLMYQTRWIQDKMIDRDKWEETPKNYNPDGSPKEDVSGFTNMITRPSTMAVVAGLLVIAFGLLISKKK